MLSTTYIAHKGYSMPKRIELCLRLIVPPIVLMSLKSIKAAAQSTFMRAH
jgi:hypothetical protein